MDGNNLDWEAHCNEHYRDLFMPFSWHGEDGGNIKSVGIHIYPEAYNHIGYNIGSGFGG